MSYPDDELRVGLLDLVDEAAPITPEEIFQRTEGTTRPIINPPRPQRGHRHLAISKISVRVAAVIFLVASLGAIVGLRLISGRAAAPAVVPVVHDPALLADSCLSPTFCVGFGVQDAKGSETLAETWNGVSWSPQVTPTPLRATHLQIRSVSCASADDCVAVGGAVFPHRGWLGLAWSWNGTRWSVQDLPLSAATATPGNKPLFEEFSDVSCSSDGYCMTVGSVFGASHERRSPTFTAIADVRLAGRGWVAVSAPAHALFEAVSCVSSSFCVAGGAALPTSHELIETWNGRGWMPAHVPSSNLGTILSISCTSVASCVALGTGDQGSLVSVIWNGHDWSVKTAATVPSGYFLVEEAVSCSSATACVAVASTVLEPPASSKHLDTQLFSYIWNGQRWTLGPAPRVQLGCSLAARFVRESVILRGRWSIC